MKLKSAAAVFVVLASVVTTGVGVAPKQGAKVAAQAQQQQTQNQQSNTSTVYKYVAQPGDSYSKIARKAVQTYGLKNKINLSNAKILFAETNITQQAGSPLLNVNQTVEIKESTVKDWVEKAQKLTATQEAAWNAYTVGVNFNTNAVGQAK